MRACLFSIFLLGLLGITACGGGASENLSVPDGWVREGNRFWNATVDTTELFRNLETVEAMGVVEGNASDTDRRAYVERNLKRNLIVLYRHNPRVVDSLFDARVSDLVAQENLGGELASTVSRLERPATRALSQAIRQPSPTKDLVEETSYVFPDSLRERVGGARIRLQVALNAEGDPVAIELLEPVHPTLDLIAVRAASEQHWSPIYLNTGREWEAIPGWVRYNVLFGRPDDSAAPQ